MLVMGNREYLSLKQYEEVLIGLYQVFIKVYMQRDSFTLTSVTSFNEDVVTWITMDVVSFCYFSVELCSDGE